MGQIAYPIEEESVGDHYDDNDKLLIFYGIRWTTTAPRDW